MIFRPLNDQILVKRASTEETTTNGGLYVPDVSREKRNVGTVIAVGPGRRLETGAHARIDVQAGDTVVFSRKGGQEIRLGAETLIVLCEADVFGVVTE